jgi:hypothetical protein
VTAALLSALLFAASEPTVTAAAPPQAEPNGVRVRMERREVRLGEPFELVVEIRHATAERYAAPVLPGPEPFRLLAVACPRSEEPKEAVTRCTLRLALFDLGPHELPDLTFAVETPGGPRELRVPGPTVTGASVLDPAARPGDLTLRDLAPPAPLLVWNHPLLLRLLGLALACAAAWMGWGALRRRLERADDPPPPLPAHERFARQLDALDEARLAEQGRGREHFFRLSEIVRAYLGAVTGQNALDLTTDELLGRLSFQPDPRLDLAALRAFLEASDLVKFARAPAGPSAAADGIAFGRTLLARTRPRPPSPAPVEEGR